jgi:type II restriction enzyme
VQGDDDRPFHLGFEEAPRHFESASQKARVWTESWVERYLFCPNCGTAPVIKLANNNRAADFACAACAEEFELKSQKGRFSRKVIDGAYEPLAAKLAARTNPNFILLNYDPRLLAVTNVLLVPRHFFTPALIEKRKPLAPTARRAGWVGCNILIDKLPTAGRIVLVDQGKVRARSEVLAAWSSTLFLRDLSLNARGWLMDVMDVVEAFGGREFTLAEAYGFEGRLSRLYPGNRNVRAKIRQQLQVLRDQGLLEFLGEGRYRATAATAS